MKTIELVNKPETTLHATPWRRQSLENRGGNWRLPSRSFSGNRVIDVKSTSNYQVAKPVKSETEMRLDILPAKVYADILSYERPGNYYGDGSSITSAQDCKAAINLLLFVKTRNSNVEMPSSISPSVDGGISLYWERGEGQLFIKVSADNATQIPYQYVSPDGIFAVGTDTKESFAEKLSLLFPR